MGLSVKMRGKHYYTNEKNIQVVIALFKIYLGRAW